MTFSFPCYLRFFSPRTATAAALCLALLAAGCAKKTARATPMVLVPTIESQPQPEPPSPNPPDTNTNAAPQTVPANTPQRDAQKPKPKPRKPVPRKPAQSAQTPPVAETPKPEPVKPTTGDNSVQITADVPRAAVQSQRQNTENLLRNSEGKLSHINRGLSDSEQGMLRQARNYIAQSNQALQGGDIERAYNLAVKANLLANELAK
jgi:outer membrane biosynthesis protein TonB